MANASQASVRKDMNMEDNVSVITADRLRKFNVARGTVAGNVIDEITAKEAVDEFAQGDLDQGEEGYGQGQEDGDEALARDEEGDEVISQMM